ncbi:MAG: PH domain-containing protein [Candidatus Micrarchaeota archaeon]|nr:PH domain-containing protein [Candidatus Micrarchaeota archaeon]
MPPRYLDKKIKLIWFLPTAFAIFLLFLIVAVFLFFFERYEFLFGLDKISFLFFFLILLILVIGLPSYLWIHLEYVSFTYELAEHELIIRYGILTRHTIVIPYHRIQNINSSRSLIERLIGLATLVIETAGTNVAASEAQLPGIAKKDLLIKEIMEKVEQSKRSISQKEKLNNTQDNILNNILTELKKLNEHFEYFFGKDKKPKISTDEFKSKKVI